MLGYLTQSAHITCAQKGSGSCPKREWFMPKKGVVHIYKPYDGGSVQMSNNTMRKMVGIGNIHMRMFDGQA